MEEEIIKPLILTHYKLKLKKAFKDYKAGDTLDAIFLPVRKNSSLTEWENKWFIYDGEKLVDIVDEKNNFFVATLDKKKHREMENRSKK